MFDNKDTFKINIHVTITVDVVPAPQTASRFDFSGGPKRIAVDSSVIKSVCYRPRLGYLGTLEVEFHSGKTYQYFKVPQGLYDDMMDGRSVGEYFNRHIRGFFQFNNITR